MAHQTRYRRRLSPIPSHPMYRRIHKRENSSVDAIWMGYEWDVSDEIFNRLIRFPGVAIDRAGRIKPTMAFKKVAKVFCGHRIARSRGQSGLPWTFSGERDIRESGRFIIISPMDDIRKLPKISARSSYVLCENDGSAIGLDDAAYRKERIEMDTLPPEALALFGLLK